MTNRSMVEIVNSPRSNVRDIDGVGYDSVLRVEDSANVTVKDVRGVAPNAKPSSWWKNPWLIAIVGGAGATLLATAVIALFNS